MTQSRWRTHSAAIISEVIRTYPQASDKELRKLISAAYPFGERSLHPYKIWCSEVNHQLAARRVFSGTPNDYADSPLFQEEAE